MRQVTTGNGERVNGVFRGKGGLLVNRNTEDLIKYTKEQKLQMTIRELESRINKLEEIVGKLLENK